MILRSLFPLAVTLNLCILWSSPPLLVESFTTTTTFRRTRNSLLYRNLRLNSSSSSYSPKANPLAQDALEKTAARLEKLQRHRPVHDDNSPPDPLGVERERICREYLLKPASALKDELKLRKLPRNGRKPDLARRLAEDDLRQAYGGYDSGKEEDLSEDVMLLSSSSIAVDQDTVATTTRLSTFAGLRLSAVAGDALGRAGFGRPSPIQAAVIPPVAKGESLILHAETGSGKTLAYLLPITEKLWSSNSETFSVIMTPTRELAAQVAGIASVLAPPNSVRMVSRPTNLMSDGVKDRGELPSGGRYAAGDSSPRLFIGSAKAIMHSLYGDGKMPAPPTSKPEAMAFLRNVRCIVLDEVDRLLAIKKFHDDKQYQKIHEKPAAVVCAAVTRLTLGRAQIIAASATVGRPLKRELARVLGLPAQECPPVVRGIEVNDDDEQQSGVESFGRAVTIPDTVQNYVVTVDGTSPGKLLTAAYGVIQSLGTKPRRMLLVLTKGFGINTQNVIGALKHFRCQPEPRSLLDALEADGTDRMIEVHREVSGASGVGQSTTSYFDGNNGANSNERGGYLLVTGEDSVRGLHLDGLDSVIVVGRPNGPDEYTHIAGRTGRAGRPGKVFIILGETSASALVSWEHMLKIKFHPVSQSEVAMLD